MFIIPCWRQTHVFKHYDFSYAIELINFIITLNFAINSLFHYVVSYLFEGRSAANSYQFYYSLFIASHYSRFRHFYHCLSLTHIRILPTTIIALPPRIHLHAMSIIVTLSLRRQVRSHLLYNCFKISYITSLCIPYTQHCNKNRLFTRVGTLIVATVYLQLIQNRYIFRSFTVLQCSHQHCVQPVASDVEVVGYL